MKKKLFFLITLIIFTAPFFTISSSADNQSGTCGEHATWSFEESTGTLTISGFGPIDDYFYSSGGPGMHPWHHLDKKILSVIIQDGITHIGDYCFADCINLSTISVPDSVQSFGRGAFYRCTSMTQCKMPEGVTKIPYSLFEGCNNLESIQIPESVTEIKGSAFESCFKLSSITIPNGVTAIEANTFWACSRLSQITLPEGITAIGNNAFELCTALMQIKIPEQVTHIGKYAFAHCNQLSEITIPASVVSIQSEFAGNCANLKTVTFLGDVPEIMFDSFKNMTVDARYPKDNATWTKGVLQDYEGDVLWYPYCTSGHEWTEWSLIQNVSCSSSAQEKRSCSFCGETEFRTTADIISHQYSSIVTMPTCTQQGYTTHICTACGHSYTDAYTAIIDHVYGSWMLTYPPTTTEPGEQIRRCIHCNTMQKEVLPIIPTLASGTTEAPIETLVESTEELTDLATETIESTAELTDSAMPATEAPVESTERLAIDSATNTPIELTEEELPTDIVPHVSSGKNNMGLVVAGIVFSLLGLTFLWLSLKKES